jgi:hypothetical protein
MDTLNPFGVDTMATIDQAIDDVIDGWNVTGRFNGIPLHLERRRYSKATFTWLYWWDGKEWQSAGDPWQSVVIPRADLVALFG